MALAQPTRWASRMAPTMAGELPEGGVPEAAYCIWGRVCRAQLGSAGSISSPMRVGSMVPRP